jgi:hypothetical protein
VIPLSCINSEACYLPGSSSPRFIGATVEHFFDTGEWPTLGLVQKRMVELYDPADARKEAKRLRYGHGWRRNDEVVLSVRGIYHAEPNHPLLDDFERAFRVATRLYKRGVRQVEATISHRDLVAKLSFSKTQAERAIALLESESLVAPGSAGKDTMVISPRIRRFLKVRNLEGYVAKKKWLDRRRHLKNLACKPFGLLRWLSREDTSIGAKILVGALALVVGSILFAAAVWGFRQLSNEPTPTPAPRAGLTQPAPADRR